MVRGRCCQWWNGGDTRTTRGTWIVWGTGVPFCTSGQIQSLQEFPAGRRRHGSTDDPARCCNDAEVAWVAQQYHQNASVDSAHRSTRCCAEVAWVAQRAPSNASDHRTTRCCNTRCCRTYDSTDNLRNAGSTHRATIPRGTIDWGAAGTSEEPPEDTRLSGGRRVTLETNSSVWGRYSRAHACGWAWANNKVDIYPSIIIINHHHQSWSSSIIINSQSSIINAHNLS